jgi:RNA polymerase sigma-70 factor (ECF subfamily)
MGLGSGFASTLSAAQSGAEWALTSLYQDLHPAVLRYLRAHEPAEADDLASETWIDAASGLTRFEGDERDFRKWMFTIARRRLLDHRRRAMRRRTDLVALEDLDGLPGEVDVETTAVDSLTAQEAIQRLVDLLPPDQAEVVLLRLVAGLSAEEVGEVMGKRPGTVRVLQHRALERLARTMGDVAVTGHSSQAM